MLRSIDHFIGGSSFASGERQGEVFDPNQGAVQAKVRLGTAADLQKAVDAANAALPGWARERVRVEARGGRVTVSLRPPSPLGAVARGLEVSSTASVREPAS